MDQLHVATTGGSPNLSATWLCYSKSSRSGAVGVRNNQLISARIDTAKLEERIARKFDTVYERYWTQLTSG